MPEFQNINYDFFVMTASVNFENWKIGLKVTDCSKRLVGGKLVELYPWCILGRVGRISEETRKLNINSSSSSLNSALHSSAVVTVLFLHVLPAQSMLPFNCLACEVIWSR